MYPLTRPNDAIYLSIARATAPNVMILQQSVDLTKIHNLYHQCLEIKKQCLGEVPLDPGQDERDLYQDYLSLRQYLTYPLLWLCEMRNAGLRHDFQQMEFALASVRALEHDHNMRHLDVKPIHMLMGLQFPEARHDVMFAKIKARAIKDMELYIEMLRNNSY